MKYLIFIFIFCIQIFFYNYNFRVFNLINLLYTELFTKIN